MAFIVQDDTGLIPDANAYIDDAFFVGYWTDRGNAEAIALTAQQMEDNIVLATQYIDDRFNFKGLPLNSVDDGQNTQFPRSFLYDDRGDIVTGLPLLLQQATAEYAWRSYNAPLSPDPVIDSTGGQVTEIRERVEGAVDTTTKWAEGVQPKTIQAYPTADRLLKQYLAAAGQLLRA